MTKVTAESKIAKLREKIALWQEQINKAKRQILLIERQMPCEATGRCDKKGLDIYTGDTLRVRRELPGETINFIGIVKKNTCPNHGSLTTYYIDDDSERQMYFYEFYNSECEIIG